MAATAFKKPPKNTLNILNKIEEQSFPKPHKRVSMKTVLKTDNNQELAPDANFNPIMEKPAIGVTVQHNAQQVYIAPAGAPPIDEMVEPFDENNTVTVDNSASKEVESQKNPSALADKIINGYCYLWKGAEKLIQISETKKEKLQDDGKIDLNTKVNFVGENNVTQVVTINEMIEDYNEGVPGSLEMDETSKERAKEILTDICAKKGAGLSPEMELGWIILEHTSINAYKTLELVKKSKDIIKKCSDATIASRELAAAINRQTEQQRQQFEREQAAATVTQNQTQKPFKEPREKIPASPLEQVSVTIVPPATTKKTRGRKPIQKAA